jgi:hypothetical protein
LNEETRAVTREARNLPSLVVHVRPGPACGVWHFRGLARGGSSETAIMSFEEE